MRDRGRVIHSAAFRRLQGKTQVMGVGEGDFHRSRLTHSIECAQIGAGLVDQLERTLGAVPPGFETWMPSRALIEAACFAHDLGHPPFGHGGEKALQVELRVSGGFESNAHTLRLLTRLEKYKHQGCDATRTARTARSRCSPCRGPRPSRASPRATAPSPGAARESAAWPPRRRPSHPCPGSFAHRASALRSRCESAGSIAPCVASQPMKSATAT